jgi:tRNA (cmo5U34)-methyltransferase
MSQQKAARGVPRDNPEKLIVPADWTFKNANVAKNFDQHVREQLPWYELATGIVSHIGRAYLPQQDGRMYDLGASTGNITLALENELRLRNVEAISIDNSPQMGEIWQGVGSFEVADVLDYDYQEYDFCVCFLLLMFLPPLKQRPFFERLLSKLRPGGALVIFDRTASFNGYLGTVMNRLQLAGKVATGVSAEDIVRKELSLSGAQRPIDPNAMLFMQHDVKEVFRFGDFAGWVAVK